MSKATTSAPGYFPSHFLNAFTTVHVSGGSLKINSINAEKKIIEGTFTVTPAGHIVGSAHGQVGTANISGAFKLKYE
ncbi:MAG: hypothetical protein KF862_01390 [Chitinophagaceae bacterium]|nr:hypothetical protein [Chitinophagaceae bacterium]